MRFLTRSLLGLFMLTLTVGLLALAANTLVQSFKANGERRGGGEARERVFTVEVMPVELKSHTPVIETYGEIISGRTLELRAAAGGEIVQLSDNFREGGFVEAGEVLFQTDPANAQSRLALAENELAEAEADLTDARRQVLLAEEEIKAAESQLALRKRALTRQSDLLDRGVGTDAARETAELAASAAEQSLLSKKLSLANAKARVARTETLVARQKINTEEARRILADTTVRAEFSGVLADVSVVLGRLVNANEQLGSLIDPDALEVAFRVSNDQFRTLSATDGGLRQASVTVEPGTGGGAFSGQVDRVSAAVGENKTGRELFAKLGSTSMLTVRPGDFVTVLVQEPPIPRTALIPASAASTSGEVLIVGAEDRLQAARVTILNKQGDDLLVRADEIEGEKLVVARAPQLGPGIKVKPRAPGGPAIEEREMVTLDTERRDRLVAAVEANTRLPDAVRERLLKALQADEVPKDMVDRLESRMAARTNADAADGTPGSTETVDVPDEQRQRMIAFIEANDRIPADRKAQILETLNQPRLPKAMVDRITQRMGG